MDRRGARLSRGPRLTPRQREVLALLADGLTRAEAAGRLDITCNTVKKHLQSAFGALGAMNTPHAVALAIRSGAIQ